jgi:hypothetical protein
VSTIPFSNLFDITFPPDTQLANQLGNDIRTFKLDIQQRMAAISGNSNNGTMFPAFVNDTQPSAWAGLLFFALDNGHTYRFNGSTWDDVTSGIGANRVMGWITQLPLGYTIPANSTLYLPTAFFNPSVGALANEGLVGWILPSSILVTHIEMVFDAGPQPSTGAMTINLRKNLAFAALLGTVTPGQSFIRISTDVNVSYLVGDSIDLELNNTAATASIGINSFGLVY